MTADTERAAGWAAAMRAGGPDRVWAEVRGFAGQAPPAVVAATLNWLVEVECHGDDGLRAAVRDWVRRETVAADAPDDGGAALRARVAELEQLTADHPAREADRLRDRRAELSRLLDGLTGCLSEGGAP